MPSMKFLFFRKKKDQHNKFNHDFHHNYTNAHNNLAQHHPNNLRHTTTSNYHLAPPTVAQRHQFYPIPHLQQPPHVLSPQLIASPGPPQCQCSQCFTVPVTTQTNITTAHQQQVLVMPAGQQQSAINHQDYASIQSAAHPQLLHYQPSPCQQTLYPYEISSPPNLLPNQTLQTTLSSNNQATPMISNQYLCQRCPHQQQQTLHPVTPQQPVTSPTPHQVLLPQQQQNINTQQLRLTSPINVSASSCPPFPSQNPVYHQPPQQHQQQLPTQYLYQAQNTTTTYPSVNGNNTYSNSTYTNNQDLHKTQTNHLHPPAQQTVTSPQQQQPQLSQQANKQQPQVNQQIQDGPKAYQQHCYTIQPHLYQHQKQQYQQQLQHSRIQSLRQHSDSEVFSQLVPPHTMVYNQHNPLNPRQNQAEMLQSKTIHDFSRYENVKSLLEPQTVSSDSARRAKYQEHVYCNSKVSESTLPPYRPPPDYETFMERMERSKFAAAMLHGRHTSHHSESIVSQRVKDSSYENLKSSLYGNLGLGKQEPGFTS